MQSSQTASSAPRRPRRAVTALVCLAVPSLVYWVAFGLLSVGIRAQWLRGRQGVRAVLGLIVAVMFFFNTYAGLPLGILALFVLNHALRPGNGPTDRQKRVALASVAIIWFTWLHLVSEWNSAFR